MKLLTRFSAILLLIFFLTGEKSFTQENQQPLFIISFNMVEDVSGLNRTFDSLFVPILKELVDEGLIYSYGHFTHLWGDEWNYNIWYTTQDMASFDKFWKEYISRLSKRHPTAFADASKYFQAHKDNIYLIRTQYPVPPTPMRE